MSARRPRPSILLPARPAIAFAVLMAACGGAWAAADNEANPVLLAQLMKPIEAREQAGGGLFGLGGPTPMASLQTLEIERQLRSLGPRAASVAPRLAQLLASTQKHAYELAWSLWSVSAPASADQIAPLQQDLAAASGADALLKLASVGASRDPAAMPVLRKAATADDPNLRLLAAIALGFQKAPEVGREPAVMLGALLGDGQVRVRQAACNGLRLLGPASSVAAPLLVAYLRTGDNPYAAATALAHAPVEDLLAGQDAIEAMLASPKLTDFQKAPGLELLMRIERHRAAGAGRMPGTAAAPVPATRPAPPPPGARDA